MIEALRARWRALAGANADAVGEALIRAYSEPHRRYHGLGHINWLLAEEERRAPLFSDRTFVQAAAWFHDAIYDPRAPDNEERSADWAREALAKLGWTLERRSAVHALIVKTKRHAEGEATPGEALFLDMDIAILGAPHATYVAYAAGVRAEYGHVPDAAFAAGRGAFLEGQLQHARLFRTDLYQGELAGQARANMRWELEALREGRMIEA